MTNEQERDTHFQECAKLLANDLEPLYNAMFYAIDDGKFQEAEQRKRFIQTFIANELHKMLAKC